MRLLALLFVLACGPAFASGGYFRHPALHGDTLVFSAEGDLWKIPVTGGDAQRLTTHPAAETHPAISPDGRWVAFSGAYEGPVEAYVMPLAGGLPRRLTQYGGVEVLGWTPAGEVLAKTRSLHPLRRWRLVVLPLEGPPRVVPLDEVDTAMQAADGTWIFGRGDRRGDNVRAYRGGALQSLWRWRPGAEATPLAPPRANDAHPLAWRDRVLFVSDRSGVGNLWSMGRDGSDPRPLTQHADFEVRRPSVSGDRVAYSLGADLRVLDLANGTDRVVPIRLVSDFDHQRERWIRKPLDQFTSARVAGNGERVAIVARGTVVTAGIGSLRRVAIALPRGARARDAQLMPDGRHVAVIADPSGEMEVWLLPADGSGPGRQLTRDAQVTRLELAVSPDGRWIAHHDRHQQLWVTEVATGATRLLDRIEQGHGQGFDDLMWSPDSRALAAVAIETNVDLPQLRLYRVADGRRVAVASSRYPSYSPAFSPDGKWLYYVANRTFTPLNPSPWGNRNMGPYFDKRGKIYALALQPGNRSPFQPRDELEAVRPDPPSDPARPGPVRVEPTPLVPPRTEPTPTPPRPETPRPDPRPEPVPPPELPPQPPSLPPAPAPSPVPDTTPAPSPTPSGQADAPSPADARPPTGSDPARPLLAAKVTPIEWNGLGERQFEVPLPAGNYRDIAVDGKRLWFLEADTSPERKTTLRSIAIDNTGVPAETFLAEVRQFEISRDGRKLFFRRWGAPGDMYLVDPTPRPPQELARFQVRLADWQYPVQPRDEWNGLFADSWRMHRDWFYDRGMRGVDWRAMRTKYAALLPRVTDREELADLLGQMSAELSLLHSQIIVGDRRTGEPGIASATLGADFEATPEGVRIARILMSDPELVSELAPLARPEVGAKVGDVLVAIDGQPVRSVADVVLALRDKTGRQVLLDLRTAREPLRRAVAVAADAGTEAELRRRDFEWRNRERVERASSGRFGYLHLAAMGGADVANFAREFYPVHRREGLIIDVRGNSGGSIDSILIEKLLRRPWAWWRGPGGGTWSNMQGAFGGALVVLVDERTYSDGEAFAEGVKRLGLGTVVGKRTSGAGVWLSDGNRLLDGGRSRAAETAVFGSDGQMMIEGVGVIPDVEVDSPPHATFEGADAQLEAALRILEQKLARKPAAAPPRPVFPKVER